MNDKPTGDQGQQDNSPEQTQLIRGQKLPAYSLRRHANILQHLLVTNKKLPPFYFTQAQAELGLTADLQHHWSPTQNEAPEENDQESLAQLVQVLLRVHLSLSRYPMNETYPQAMQQLQDRIDHLKDQGFSYNRIAQHLRFSFRALEDITLPNPNGEQRPRHCPWSILERLEEDPEPIRPWQAREPSGAETQESENPVPPSVLAQHAGRRFATSVRQDQKNHDPNMSSTAHAWQEILAELQQAARAHGATLLPTPLLPYPDASTITRQVLLLLQQAQEENLPGYRYDPHIPALSPRQVRSLAPDLEEVADRLIREYQLPEPIGEMLQMEEKEAARQVVAHLPADQQQALSRAIIRAIARQQPEP